MSNLFQNIADLKSVFPQVHRSQDDLMTYVDDAIDLYMVEYLSQEFYDELVQALTTASYDLNALTAAQKAIINHLRTAAAYYGFYEALPYINIHVSNTGAMSHSGEGAAGVRQWESRDARRAAIHKADQKLDKALSIMEATPASYTTWSGSDAFTVQKKHLITNADDFKTKGLLDINKSRRTYLRLVPFIAKAESHELTDCMGSTLLTSIKSKIKAGTALEAKETILMDEHIYPALAHYAMYHAAGTIRLDISSSGITLITTADGSMTKQEKESAFVQWRREVYGDAQRYLSNAKKYLDDNSADFADYTSDDASENDTPQYQIPDNSGSSSSVIM